MRILMTTFVFTVGLMFATTGFAGNEIDLADAATEEMPTVEAAPPEQATVSIDEIDVEAADGSETVIEAVETD